MSELADIAERLENISDQTDIEHEALRVVLLVAALRVWARRATLDSTHREVERIIAAAGITAEVAA